MYIMDALLCNESGVELVSEEAAVIWNDEGVVYVLPAYGHGNHITEGETTACKHPNFQ